jgi:hypothetical protein
VLGFVSLKVRHTPMTPKQQIPHRSPGRTKLRKHKVTLARFKRALAALDARERELVKAILKKLS